MSITTTLYLKKTIIIPAGTVCRYVPQDSEGCQCDTVELPLNLADPEAGFGGEATVYVGPPDSKERVAASEWFSTLAPAPSATEVSLSIEDRVDITYNKELRVELDRQLQVLKDLTPSRERSLAITKLQEAIMWLGMDLKRLGTPTPYPNSYKPENTVVDPTADGLRL